MKDTVKKQSAMHYARVKAVVTSRWFIIGASLFFTIRYLVWRATSTLNFITPGNTAVSVLLYAAEIFGFISLILFYSQALYPEHPVPPPDDGKAPPMVDVFVTIFNEPAAILYRTLIGVEALDYPRALTNVYILDDGGRDEIRRLADDFGFRYIARKEHKHAKAGNLNNALKCSQGELILILDCDHVPVRSFLKETVPFFRDAAVGFVQTPHHFYNPDTFQRNLHLEEELIHEQDLFFKVMQPGRNKANSVVFAGSAGVMKRAALEAVGGVRVEVAIEDLHTSMELQKHGYKGIFLDKPLSAGLSPEDFSSFLTQRRRWTRGGVQLFIIDNPLLQKRFSLMQRIHYFGSLLYFFHAWPRLVFLFAPLSFLLFGLNPLITGPLTLMHYFLPHFILGHLAFTMGARGYRNAWWSDVYEAAAVFALAKEVVMTLLDPLKLVFHVTPKGDQISRGQGKIGFAYVLPHLLLMGMLLLGVIVATYRLAKTGLRVDAYALSMAWTMFNLICLGCAIEVSRERIQPRGSLRLARSFPCEMLYRGKKITGFTEDVSQAGTALRLDGEHYPPPHVRIVLPDAHDRAKVFEADTMRTKWSYNGTSSVGLRFKNLTAHDEKEILKMLFTRPDSWKSKVLESHGLWSSFQHMALVPLRRRFLQGTRPRRSWPRIYTQVACTLEKNGIEYRAVTKDISAVGVSLFLPLHCSPAGECLLTIALEAGNEMKIRVKTARKISATNDSKLCGFAFRDPSHLDMSAFSQGKWKSPVRPLIGALG